MRCSAAGTASGLALMGICRKSSAKNGSSSVISSVPLLRKTSMSVGALDRGEEEITMQLLDEQLGPLAHATPQDGAPVSVHLQHVLLGLLLRITKNPLKNHRYVGHQVDRIVMHHHLPWQIERLLCPNLFRDLRTLDRAAYLRGDVHRFPVSNDGH